MHSAVKVLYFDTAATTPVAPDVLMQMFRILSGEQGDANPASTHLPGQTAADIIEAARAEIAAELGAEPDEVIFTSGAMSRRHRIGKYRKSPLMKSFWR